MQNNSEILILQGIFFNKLEYSYFLPSLGQKRNKNHKREFSFTTADNKTISKTLKLILCYGKLMGLTITSQCLLIMQGKWVSEKIAMAI